ncbi:MAG: glycoside hydrolase family 25 protein [Arenimonas sp.]|nr:glycoside hydrolase family 25 protein [Arenimonas sp.]
MRNSIKAIIIGAVILATAGTVQIWYRNGMTSFEPPTLEDYPIQGIDVSHHQGDIDWSRLAVQQEVRFALIKATEGGDFRDRKFTENWQGAKHAGIVRGAYHFFTFCRPGRDQARNVIATVPREPDTLPIAVDIEFHGNCDKVPTVDELAAELHAFMDELGAVFPGKPIFYVDEDFHDRYLRGNEAVFPEHFLWLRSIAREPKQQDCRRWSIWQFADNGSLDGIQGPVDLNALCPSEEGFASLFPTGPEN